jgi:hypothetical protein
MVIHNVEQRSSEWYKLRLGKVGGSEADGLMTPAKMKTLINKKLAEIITGEAEEVFVNEAMRYGIETESEAAREYGISNMCEPKEVGYVTNVDYPMFGLSPDRIVSNTIAVEIKCPTPKSFVQYVIDGKPCINKVKSIPKKYLPQCSMYFLMMPKIEELDFVVYNDNIKSANRMYQTRVSRNDMEMEIEKLKAASVVFEKKMKESLIILKSL